MAKKKILVDIDLNQNEIQNPVLQNLVSDPESGSKEGRFWMNTTSHVPMYFDGTENKEFGKVYTEGAGIDITGDVISIDNTVTGATKCKITYDNNGLVTAGADLAETDIPSLSLSKISDVTASASEVNVLDGITATTAELNILDGVTADASEINVLDGITADTAELNILDGVTVTASDINSIPDKIELTDLSVASASSDYLTYDNTTGEIGANVDTTVTASSTNLVTSGAVATAIDNAVVGGMVYKGVWTASGQTDYSSITLPVKAGYMYLVSGSATIGGIEWNTDDYLVINADVAAGGTITDVKKIDNTEGSDIVRLNAAQTLTNKTIDADDNTISDLAVGNFKSGVVVTSIGTTGADTSIPTEKAVRDAIAGTAFSVTNAVLTATSGVATWSITNTLGTATALVQVFEVATNEQVMVDVAVTASTITVKINSASNIAADTYRAVVIG